MQFMDKRSEVGSNGCRELPGGRVSQEIKQGSVWIREISLKAVSLEQEKILCGGVGFGLGHEARFANPGFPAEQDHLPSSTFCLINQGIKRGEFTDAINQTGQTIGL